ncbi:MAG: acetate kinase, partial [Candidatus Firestonebacteria bacterium]
YMAVLNGTDAIVFTGGIGEKDEFVREYICSNMETLGIKFEAKRNLDKANKEREISAEDSKVRVFIIPTDEEVRIAADTYENVK